MRYYMLNKPYGHISARSDPKYPTVMDCFPPEDRYQIFPVGRLDVDTTGLLILTDDGWFSHCLTYPGFKVVKEYFFMAFGEVTQEHIDRIAKGSILPGNGLVAAPAKVVVEEITTVAQVEQYLPERIRVASMKNPTGKVTIGRVFVTEGRKHEVKLLIRSTGCHIFLLRRDSIGGVRLDSSLKQGQYRELTEEEVRALRPQ